MFNFILQFKKAKVYFYLLNNQYELVDNILSNDLNSEKDRDIIMNRIKDLHPELVP